MSKRTPGPWSWEDNEGFGYSLSPGVILTDYTDGTPWGDEIDKANAHLIAAAPELLEACERAEWWLTTIEGSEAIRSILRTAISKAEGK